MGSYKKVKKQKKSPDTTKDELGSYNYRMFNFFNRKFKITEAEPPADVKEIFAKFSGGQRQMSVEQFRRFLVLHQDLMDCTLADAQRIVEDLIKKRHHETKYKNRRGFTLEDFFHFLLFDDLNGPIIPQVSSPVLSFCSFNLYAYMVNLKEMIKWVYIKFLICA